MREVRITCDQCGDAFADNTPAAGVTGVCAKIGGNGAAESHFGPADLCRVCYSEVHLALKLAFQRAPNGAETPIKRAAA